MPIYRLGSNELVHAPGVVTWAINGYHFKRDRAVLRRVIVDGWPGVPDHAAHQLLSGAAPHHVDGDTVVFKVDDSAPATPVAERPSPSIGFTLQRPEISVFMCRRTSTHTLNRANRNQPGLLCVSLWSGRAAALAILAALASVSMHWNSIRRSRTRDSLSTASTPAFDP